MFSQILDQKTYLAVLNAAPDVPGEYDRVAKEIVSYLWVIANLHATENRNFLEVSIKDISENLDISAHLCGRLVGQLGLLKIRRRDGYQVFFTVMQLKILNRALDVEARS